MAKTLYTVPEALDIVTLFQQSIVLNIVFKDGVYRKNLDGFKFKFEVFDYYANQTFLVADSQVNEPSKKILISSSVGGSDTIKDKVRVEVDFIGTSNKPLDPLNYSYRLSCSDANNVDLFVLHGKLIVLESMNEYYEQTKIQGGIEVIFSQNTVEINVLSNANQEPYFEYLFERNGIVIV